MLIKLKKNIKKKDNTPIIIKTLNEKLKYEIKMKDYLEKSIDLANLKTKELENTMDSILKSQFIRLIQKRNRSFNIINNY